MFLSDQIEWIGDRRPGDNNIHAIRKRIFVYLALELRLQLIRCFMRQFCNMHWM